LVLRYYTSYINWISIYGSINLSIFNSFITKLILINIYKISISHFLSYCFLFEPSLYYLFTNLKCIDTNLWLCCCCCCCIFSYGIFLSFYTSIYEIVFWNWLFDLWKFILSFDLLRLNYKGSALIVVGLLPILILSLINLLY
jgi:hypothetical protein